MLKKIDIKKQKKYEKLMNSAFKLFTEKGVNNTTIQDIADKSGLAKGTFYLYFRDKDEIQNELIIRKSKKLFEDALKKLEEDKPENFVDQIIFIIDYIIDKLAHNPLLLKFITKNLSWGVYNDKINKLVDDSTIGIHDMFKKAIKDNNVKIDNPDVTLFMIIELTSSTVFTSIIKKQPLQIKEFKPYLYKAIKGIICSAE